MQDNTGEKVSEILSLLRANTPRNIIMDKYNSLSAEDKENARSMLEKYGILTETKSNAPAPTSNAGVSATLPERRQATGNPFVRKRTVNQGGKKNKNKNKTKKRHHNRSRRVTRRYI